MVAGGLLPWLSLFNGLTTVQGFSVDGGMLALVTLAVVALLFVQARHGGTRILRPIAILAAMAIVADSLYSAWRIATASVEPGPSPLTRCRRYAARSIGTASRTPSSAIAHADHSRTVSCPLPSRSITAGPAAASPTRSKTSIADNWPNRSSDPTAAANG
jgi:hypothetical protein